MSGTLVLIHGPKKNRKKKLLQILQVPVPATYPESILNTMRNAVMPRRVPTEVMYSFKMGIFFSSSPSVSANPNKTKRRKKSVNLGVDY